jgi:hypothetical protein
LLIVHLAWWSLAWPLRAAYKRQYVTVLDDVFGKPGGPLNSDSPIPTLFRAEQYPARCRSRPMERSTPLPDIL